MKFLALVRASSRTTDLMSVASIAVMLCVALCFVRVMGYAVAQARSGRLIGGPDSPPPFRTPNLLGWSFVFIVIALLFLQSPLYLVVVVLCLSAFLVEGRRTAREQFGLDRIPITRVMLWSLLICGAVIFVELPLSELIDRGMTAIHLPHPEQESVEVFRHIRRPGEISLFLIQAVVISPLIEELFFRGFLFTFLKNYTTTVFSLVLSAGVFAFAHANLGSVLQLWILGIALGLAYEHSGSLLLPMGIHACWNFFTAMSLLFDPGAS